MRMVLTELNTLVQMDDEKTAPKEGFKRLRVL